MKNFILAILISQICYAGEESGGGWLYSQIASDEVISSDNETETTIESLLHAAYIQQEDQSSLVVLGLSPEDFNLIAINLLEYDSVISTIEGVGTVRFYKSFTGYIMNSQESTVRIVLESL